MTEQLDLNIEGTVEDERQLRIIHEPTKDEIKTMRERLSIKTKGQLQTMATPYIGLLRKLRLRYDRGNGETETPAPIEKLEKTKLQNRSVWEEFIAIMYHELNHSIIFENMPKHEIELWREVLLNYYVVDTEVERIMGRKCFKKSSSFWDDSKLEDYLASFFSCKNALTVKSETSPRQVKVPFIYYDSPLKKSVFREFFPDLINFKDLEKLPEEANLKQFSGENTVFTKLPLLSALYDSLVLPHIYGKPKATLIKKVQKTIQMPRFFDNYPNAKQAQLSTTMITNFFMLYRATYPRKLESSQPEQIVKDIFDNAFRYRSNVQLLPTLLSYTKGIRCSPYDMDMVNDTLSVLYKLLFHYSKKNWIPVDALIMNLRSATDTSDYNFLLLHPNIISYADISNCYTGDTCIDFGNTIRQFSIPFIKSLLFALSTFGIVEVAYRDPDDTDTSPYDGLQYVRVTELGKYVFEASKSYSPQQSANTKSDFELDDQRLLIKVRTANSPFIHLLDNFAQSITPTLYRVDYETFLGGCSSKNDLERKIKMFCMYICKKQPEIWKQFFDELLSKCHPFSDSKEKYLLIEIPSDNIELQRLMLNEPSIRKYVLKVENYMMLVKADEEDKLKLAMKKFGYLI